MAASFMAGCGVKCPLPLKVHIVFPLQVDREAAANMSLFFSGK
jgi:hypothetical protein